MLLHLFEGLAFRCPLEVPRVFKRLEEREAAIARPGEEARQGDKPSVKLLQVFNRPGGLHVDYCLNLLWVGVNSSLVYDEPEEFPGGDAESTLCGVESHAELAQCSDASARSARCVSAS